MGNVSIKKASNLFWLGRYIERTYTTIKATKDLYDCYVDGAEGNYAEYCQKLGIPNTYQDTDDFIVRYMADESNPFSIISSLNFAYDNGIVLRDTLHTGTLSYIQMAVNAISVATQSDAPEIELQWVLDDIMAFRGSCDEEIDDEDCNTIIKVGSSLERVDLYTRLDYPAHECTRQLEKLVARLQRSNLTYDEEKINNLVANQGILGNAGIDKGQFIADLESLILGV